MYVRTGTVVVTTLVVLAEARVLLPVCPFLRSFSMLTKESCDWVKMANAKTLERC